MTQPRTAWILGALSIGVLTPGCARETRVVKFNPFLGGLPGATSGAPIVRDLGDYTDPTAIPPDQLRREEEPGKVLLTAKSGRHLMIHIHTTLRAGDRDLFTTQVLSAMTRAECLERGIDPGEAFDYFKTREDDIAALFNMMPAGEQTPGVIARRLGRHVMRVQVSGLGTEDLYWTGFDMVMEKGSWRLRWFVR
ncbi:MAG: hypothetical protein HBSAPP03_17660 [Phycisphaerae bacterium]|nr:MAG: hypothetical protein HBSAPP03_17660 [Phycisphaerae bacterium]